MMIIYLLSLLSLLLYQPMNVQAGKSALCFLTQRLAPETLEFARELAQDAVQYDVEIFIIIDDNNFNLSDVHTSLNLHFLQLSTEKCLQHNYRKSIWMGNSLEVTAWDKALLYFCVLDKNYSFVWFSEYDVFFPSIQAFRSLHELYSDTSDFIVPRVGLNLLANISIWMYIMEMGQFIPPWACSVVNVIGLSRRMLIAIDDYVQWLGQVPFHEFFFNTLAIQLNLTIVTPTELSTDIYLASFSFEDIHKQPNNLWHPCKSLDVQKRWRESLANESLINNTNIDLTNIEMLCDDNQNMTSIEQHLTDLLVKFKICKSKFSANNRRELRQRFSHLAEQCQKQYGSKKVVSLARELADHAYKLPELPVEELVTDKSAHHLKLEHALKKNKKKIFRSTRNSSILTKLRRQTAKLINELTSEIQREYKERERLRNQTRLSSTSTTLLSSRSTTTIHLFSMTQMPIVNMTHIFYKLLNENGNQTLGSQNDHKRIVLLISFVFCVLFVLLVRKKAQRQTYSKHIFICSCLLLIGISYNIKSISLVQKK